MTISPNIFKIDKEHRLLRTLTKTDDIINTIIKDAFSKAGLKLQKRDLELTEFKKGNITYYLYLHSIPEAQSEWASFLPEELTGNTDKFNQTKISLILFINTEHELYAIVGGNAFRIIVNFIDHLFGLTTYDRIISLDGDEATSTKSRGITGQRIGMSEQFRDQYKMINYLQFGKIPKELHVKLNVQTVNDHFSFLLSKPSDRLNVTFGKAIRINKQVDFNTLHRLVEELGVILEMAPQDLLSSYIQIRDLNLIDELQKELNRRIYNNIPVILGTSNSYKDNFEFDFCSPNNIEAFYEAESYQLKEKREDKHEPFATVTDKDIIYDTVVRRAYELHGNDETSILYYLRGVRIHCYLGKKQTTSSGFFYHFNAELSIRDEPVFLIDTKWYKLKDAFVRSLTAQTEILFKSSKLMPGILNKSWDRKLGTKAKLIDEGDYNKLYNGLPGYFVMDTITPDGVELCDIIYMTSTELYLIHVKHSFTARVRELTNQISISARRVSEAVAAKNHSYFQRVYSSILKKGRSVNQLNEKQFADLFFERKLIYVFATASQFENDPLIEDNISLYKSNIARFSLTTCASEVRTNYSIDFLTCQIKRG
ncbi:DUF6119 family protein [Desertivirga brevis]|uniref:DUF6119 family protein n=1 Tax=Desertivirga brevis TaxID=2810310 RepID=UPI001A97C0FB|nr:DUF6119 family protein [Pedobacter sp. SYSU D00873]